MLKTGSAVQPTTGRLAAESRRMRKVQDIKSFGIIGVSGFTSIRQNHPAHVRPGNYRHGTRSRPNPACANGLRSAALGSRQQPHPVKAPRQVGLGIDIPEARAGSNKVRQFAPVREVRGCLDGVMARAAADLQLNLARGQEGDVINVRRGRQGDGQDRVGAGYAAGDVGDTDGIAACIGGLGVVAGVTGWLWRRECSCR